jgi:hypothetical protein
VCMTKTNNLVLYQIPAPTSRRTVCVSMTKTNNLVLHQIPVPNSQRTDCVYDKDQ